MIYFKNIDRNSDFITYIENNNGFDCDPGYILKDFKFHEFDLTDLGLPSPEELLNSVIELRQSIKLQGWKKQNWESPYYKGFSLTSNPDFFDKTASVFHQTWGSELLTQHFSRKLDTGLHEETKNTYYDSYAFRHVPDIIKEKLGYLINSFSFPILRSRVAYQFGFGKGETKVNDWHIDEPPFQILRINIPLQTSEEHVIDIVGDDGFGNSLEIMNKHLEVGKLYMWNTRIPHRISFNKLCKNKLPRIHIVLGLSPWFDYDQYQDQFSKNDHWGKPIKEIIDSRCFIKG